MDEKKVVLTDSEKHYRESLVSFTEALEQCLATSHQAAGINGSVDLGSGISEGQRRYWASILFTRLCTNSISLLLLCPGSKINPKGAHWDLAAVASSVRSLFELSLVFFYLAIEKVAEDEWLTRLRVMQLHDCTSRISMFRNLGWTVDELKGFEQQAAELRERMKKNSFFLGLPQSGQIRFLTGNQASMLTKDEILKRTGETSTLAWGYYGFLSSHVHHLPLGFYRTGENNRGRGVENDADRGHMSGALAFAAGILSNSNEQTQELFAGVVTFSPKEFDWSLLFKAT